MIPEPAAPPLSLMDLMECKHERRKVEVPAWLTSRLRGLGLLGCKHEPEGAFHQCKTKLGCVVILLQGIGGVAIDRQDWALAASPESDATRGIVVEDHTTKRSRR